MPRPTRRFLAVAVLALLGAPVALHVVLHDLHHHHQEGDPATAAWDAAEHGDHEHPVVSSAAPQMSTPVRATMPPVVAPTPSAWMLTTRAGRNTITHGALRLDDDVGLQPLLSTFLI